MSRTANDENSSEEVGWSEARNELFRMIMEGRSFSGRERNCCFLNMGQQGFATVSAISGLDFLDDGRCLAVTDWDGDGDQDLWISNRNGPRLRLMRNNTTSRNRFVSLSLVGDGEQTNRDAIGARVEVEFSKSARAMPLVKTLRAGEGFLSQSSKVLHIGLGTHDKIDQVVVHWPGGTTETFAGVGVDGQYRLSQGQGAAEPIASDRSVALQPAIQQPPAATRAARVLLQTRLPMPTVEFVADGGSRVRERFTDGNATLINLWASWCSPCIQELSDLASRAEDLAAAKLEVISLSVDTLEKQPGTSADAAAIAQKIGYPHSWGFVDAVQMERLQQLHNQLFFQRKALPLPTSLLIDREGRLAAIYRGPVTVEQLLSDMAQPAEGYAESFEKAACLPGRAIRHGGVSKVAKTVEIHTRYLLAAWLAESEMDQDAIEHFRELYQLNAEWAVPQRHLAKLYLKRNQLDQAAEFALNAMRLDPQDAQAHNTYALVCSEQSDQRKAELHLRKAIQLDAEFAEAHNNLGTVLASQGKLAEAGQSFQQAVRLDDQFVQAIINLGSVYAALGKLDRAIAHYRRAIQIDANSADAHNNLGTIYARRGDLQRAIQCYQDALRVDPGNVDARRNLNRAQTLLKSGT